MRITKAVAVASICFAALASAQMKKPAAPDNGNSMQPALETARRISRADAEKFVKEGKAVYVDVRSKEQYDLGHIKGALSIPGSELITRLREITPGKMIIAYCA